MKLLLCATLVVAAFAKAPSTKFEKFYGKFLDSKKQGLEGKKAEKRTHALVKGDLDLEGFTKNFFSPKKYEVIDQDNDGVIWFQELMAFSKYMREHPHFEHITGHTADTTADDHETIVQNMMEQASPHGYPYVTTKQYADWRAKESFNVYDTNSDGTVTPKELADRLFNSNIFSNLRQIKQNPSPDHSATVEQIKAHPFDHVCQNSDSPFANHARAPRRDSSSDSSSDSSEHKWGKGKWGKHGKGRGRGGQGERRGLYGLGTIAKGACNYVSDGSAWCDAAGTASDCMSGNLLGCAGGVWDMFG